MKIMIKINVSDFKQLITISLTNQFEEKQLNQIEKNRSLNQSIPHK